MSHHQNAGQIHTYNLLTVIKYFENIVKFKYFGMTVINQNCIYEEIKCNLNFGDAYHHSVHSLLSSYLMFKNLQIKIYKIIILLAVLCGCETWSVTLKEEHGLRVLKNRVLRKIFGPKRKGSDRRLENTVMRSFITCVLYQIVLGWLSQE
jgi:hypothetical protein